MASRNSSVAAEGCVTSRESLRMWDCEVKDRPSPLLQLSVAMPKMKSHSGSKKRFKVTGGGKLRGRHAMTSHILEKKSAKRKRRLSTDVEVAKADEKRVKKLLGV